MLKINRKRELLKKYNHRAYHNPVYISKPDFDPMGPACLMGTASAVSVETGVADDTSARLSLTFYDSRTAPCTI